MENNATAMVMAAFLADSLALGVHWIYDVAKIENEHGRVDRLLATGLDSFHGKREKGAFTHYGDQSLALLESVSRQKGFDPNDFSETWQALFKEYDGYYDHATKDTLKNISNSEGILEAGSDSSDFAGAARIAPLVYCYRDDLPKLIEMSRTQTKMTHNNDNVIASAEFLARVTFAVLKGEGPVKAMEATISEHFEGSRLKERVDAGLASTGSETISAIGKFGQTCNSAEVLPGIVHLIATYENNLEEALVQAVMAGGDSSARGMATAMVLGAHLGYDSLPKTWLEALKARESIIGFLDRLQDQE